MNSDPIAVTFHPEPRPNRHGRRKNAAKERAKPRPKNAAVSWYGGSVDLVSALLELDSKFA